MIKFSLVHVEAMAIAFLNSRFRDVGVKPIESMLLMYVTDILSKYTNMD